MRVNSRVFTERVDMLDGIQIPNCPRQIKVVAKRIVMLASKPGYAIGEYHTMTQLDKRLMVDYWKEYDGEPTSTMTFRDWFVLSATEPELIRRARQWLVEHNYLLLDESVRANAQEAGSKFRQSVRGK